MYPFAKRRRRSNSSELVVILARIRQQIISRERRRAALIGEGKDIGRALLDEVGAGKDRPRQLTLDADAPIQGPRLVQRAVVGGELGLLRRAGRRYTVGRVVRVVTNAGQRLRSGIRVVCARSRGRCRRRSSSGSCRPAASKRAANRGETSGRRTISSQSKRSPGSTSHPFARLPAILNVRANFGVVQRKGRRRSEMCFGARAFRLRADS